jgi:hypothetical protein
VHVILRSCISTPVSCLIEGPGSRVSSLDGMCSAGLKLVSESYIQVMFGGSLLLLRRFPTSYNHTIRTTQCRQPNAHMASKQLRPRGKTILESEHQKNIMVIHGYATWVNALSYLFRLNVHGSLQPITSTSQHVYCVITSPSKLSVLPV